MKTDMELRQERDAHRKAARQIGKQLRKRSRKAHGLGPRKKGMGVRIGDRDEAEKVIRGWLEAGSYVRRDGSEKLVGRDWRTRKREIWVRGDGRCERIVEEVVCSRGEVLIPEQRCKNEMHDPHHKVERRRGRDDRAENLIGLCRLHHDLLDPRKIRSGKVGA
jgi:hypothetical protein